MESDKSQYGIVWRVGNCRTRSGHVRIPMLAWIAVLLLLVTSCNSVERQAGRFQKQLIEQQKYAMSITEQVVSVLGGNSFDSLRVITSETKDVIFYVFDSREAVYWSDNRLSASFYLTKYDSWELIHFDNAWGVGRWTRAAGGNDLWYNVLTVIPIKNDYIFENKYLQNEYIQPFRLDKSFEIRRSRAGEGIAITDEKGQYIFTLVKKQGSGEESYQSSSEQLAHQESQQILSHGSTQGGSFSYQSILTPEQTEDKRLFARATVYYYIVFALLFVVALIILGVYGLVRNRGIKNMSMGVKFQYLIVLMQLVAFGYVFVVSVYYVNSRFEERQSEELLKKAGYIQKSLQNLYPWTVDLSARSSESMNVELRDLCYAYETDIQVYDLKGNLIGSSSPAIFDMGIISRHIDSEPFFSGKMNRVWHDRIGKMPYLTAYTEFYNGSYVQIGYIEVPYYVMQDERRRALDDFLSRLFPPYLVVMVLAVILGLLFSRSLTRPLKSLTDGLSHFRIGMRNAHLDYDGGDEVGRLVREYNRMVDELEESTLRLAQSEREGAWRTMARQIAHEINNPLTPMKLNIQQLQRLKQTGDERFDAYFERTTKMLIEQIDTLSHIASSFSSFAKMPEVHAERTDVAAALFSVITLFRTNQQKVPIRYVGAEYDVFAFADSEQLPQVFTNLIKNALQALEGQADADIIVMLKDLKDEVEITISDNGPGINKEVRDKVFMPNFTTKSNGAGLGLAISKNIIEGAGGQISFETSSKGTSFFVKLKK